MTTCTSENYPSFWGSEVKCRWCMAGYYLNVNNKVLKYFTCHRNDLFYYFLLRIILSDKGQVSLYHLMWHMLYIIFIVPICSVTMPLVHAWVNSNFPFFWISYLYTALLLSIIYHKFCSCSLILFYFVVVIFADFRFIFLTY